MATFEASLLDTAPLPWISSLHQLEFQSGRCSFIESQVPLAAIPCPGSEWVPLSSVVLFSTDGQLHATLTQVRSLCSTPNSLPVSLWFIWAHDVQGSYTFFFCETGSPSGAFPQSPEFTHPFTTTDHTYMKSFQSQELFTWSEEAFIPQTFVHVDHSNFNIF